MDDDHEHLRQVCRMGQGSACCRYLVGDGDGIHCGKLDRACKDEIDRRVVAGLFTAIADNCHGRTIGERL